MKKIFFSGVLLTLFFSCIQDKKIAVTETIPDANFDTKKFPPKILINAKANELLQNWTEFNAFETSFDALYRITNTADLTMVIEDLIEKQKLLENSEFPELFKKPQIRSRQKVVKTFILKIKGDLEYKVDPKNSVLETIEAYNSFRNQFNVLANNTLDTELILNE